MILIKDQSEMCIECGLKISGVNGGNYVQEFENGKLIGSKHRHCSRLKGGNTKGW